MTRGRGKFEELCKQVGLLQEGSTISVCCITRRGGERLIEQLKARFPQHRFELLVAGQTVRGKHFNMVMEDIDTNWADEFEATHPNFAARSRAIEQWIFKELLPQVEKTCNQPPKGKEE